MNRDSNASIIPKIILILATLSVLGIILLFFRSRTESPRATSPPPESPDELFAQVIKSGSDQVLKLWEEGDRFMTKNGLQCPEEVIFQSSVGRSYYQCQPHLWECYWRGGVTKTPALKVDVFGQTYHVRARPAFDAIAEYSSLPRHSRFFKRRTPGLPLHYGYVIELEVEEIPGRSQAFLLSDTCRDVYLPERIYGHGKLPDKKSEGFIWDNFERKIFIDKFYVSNQQVNEWRLESGERQKIVRDRRLWPSPAMLDIGEQRQYCAFLGKRALEAKLFDAATMPPSDLKNPLPDRVIRPQTPWHRDLSKSFLGMARINADYQLTPLDCQLAQVQGCPEKLYSTDSVSWMGINYALGFYPESLVNPIDKGKNLKVSSRFLPAASEWHELGVRSTWRGLQSEQEVPVAFRCYEEVSL